MDFVAHIKTFGLAYTIHASSLYTNCIVKNIFISIIILTFQVKGE